MNLPQSLDQKSKKIAGTPLSPSDLERFEQSLLFMRKLRREVRAFRAGEPIRPSWMLIRAARDTSPAEE